MNVCFIPKVGGGTGLGSNPYTLTNASPLAKADYYFWCVVFSPGKMFWSNSFSVTVNPNSPAITT